VQEQFAGTPLEAEAAKVKRSPLGRYKRDFDELGKKMREAREVAAVWAEKLGSEPQGDIGKVVMELLRTIAFDATLDLHENSIDGVNPKDLNALALAVHRLETAGRHSLEREKAQRKAALDEAARNAGAAAKEAGISEEAIKLIRDRIMLGMSG
jgi:hypothetical protein